MNMQNLLEDTLEYLGNRAVELANKKGFLEDRIRLDELRILVEHMQKLHKEKYEY